MFFVVLFFNLKHWFLCVSLLTGRLICSVINENKEERRAEGRGRLNPLNPTCVKGAFSGAVWGGIPVGGFCLHRKYREGSRGADYAR